jgi:DNA-binding PadR family transcriptional regulator
MVVYNCRRLEQQGWIKSERRPTDTGRMAKFYSLTRSGRHQLDKIRLRLRSLFRRRKIDRAWRRVKPAHSR